MWSGLTTFSQFGGAVGTNQPLPVELLNFSAQCLESQIELTWQTASEFNSSHFVVEKTRDGETWSELTVVNAAGSSNEIITYTYEDNTVLSQQYYRLRQVDVDGAEKLYDPIVVNCTDNSSSYFTSYPNPSNEIFNVVLKDKEIEGGSKLIIRDNNAKELYQISIKVLEGLNLFVIDKPLTPGLYFIEIINSEDELITIKHVVK
jgi:hypothetical protein